MHSLTERMDKHYTKTDADLIKEEISETRPSVKGRREIKPGEKEDVLRQRLAAGGGVRSSISYLCQQSLKLPLTIGNRHDYTPLNQKFGIAERIGGVLRLTRYTFNWRSAESITNLYNTQFVEPVNQIKDRYSKEYGLNLTHIQPQKGQNNGIMGMAVMDDTLQDKIRKFLQNTGGADCVAVPYYFIMGKNGEVLRENVPEKDLREFFKQKWETGAAELRNQGADYQIISQYCKELAALDVDLKTFNVPSIVAIMTTYEPGPIKNPDGTETKQKAQGIKLYNYDMTTVIGESSIRIDPNYFIRFVKKIYRDND